MREMPKVPRRIHLWIQRGEFPEDWGFHPSRDRLIMAFPGEIRSLPERPETSLNLRGCQPPYSPAAPVFPQAPSPWNPMIHGLAPDNPPNQVPRPAPRPTARNRSRLAALPHLIYTSKSGHSPPAAARPPKGTRARGTTTGTRVSAGTDPGPRRPSSPTPTLRFQGNPPKCGAHP